MELHSVEEVTADRSRIVLVVDRNQRNRTTLTALLRHFSYEACMVSTVEEALATAKVVKPALIIIAGQIDAEHSALAFIRAYRSSGTKSAAPMVVITAKTDRAFERECLNAGAVTCLCAPVTFENFYRVVQVAVEPIPRMNIRINTELPAAIDGKRTDECVSEISENGAYILTSSPRPLNTKLIVRIKLPDGVVSAEAVVLYSHLPETSAAGRSGMGLQFLQISQEDQQRIHLFIRQAISRGILPASSPPGTSSGSDGRM